MHFVVIGDEAEAVDVTQEADHLHHCVVGLDLMATVLGYLVVCRSCEELPDPPYVVAAVMRVAWFLVSA